VRFGKKSLADQIQITSPVRPQKLVEVIRAAPGDVSLSGND
jgi:hypothetical protein